MPESDARPTYSSGESFSRATFPLRAPPSDNVEQGSSSIIPDDHTAVTFHEWLGPDPVLGNFSEDPVTFECDNRPFTAHPTRRERTDQKHTLSPSPIIESPHRITAPSFPSVPRHKVGSAPQLIVRSPSKANHEPLRHVNVEHFPQVKPRPPPPVHVTSLSEGEIEEVAQSRGISDSNPKLETQKPLKIESPRKPSGGPTVRDSQMEIAPLKPLNAERFPQMPVEPIVPTNLSLRQQVALGSSNKSIVRSSGSSPHLVVETPKTSSVRTSRDAEGAGEKQSSVRHNSSRRRSDAAPDKSTGVGALGSFAYGTFLGLLPVLLAGRLAVHYFRKGEDHTAWDERWLKYGVTFGLFLIVGIALVVVIVNIS